MKEFKFISGKKKEKIMFFNNKELLNGIKNNGLRIELLSNRTAVAEGCAGVVDYRDDYIKIRVKKGYVIFYGKNLNISYFENNSIKIDGELSNVEFCF